MSLAYYIISLQIAGLCSLMIAPTAVHSPSSLLLPALKITAENSLPTVAITIRPIQTLPDHTNRSIPPWEQEPFPAAALRRTSSLATSERDESHFEESSVPAPSMASSLWGRIATSTTTYLTSAALYSCTRFVHWCSSCRQWPDIRPARVVELVCWFYSRVMVEAVAKVSLIWPARGVDLWLVLQPGWWGGERRRRERGEGAQPFRLRGLLDITSSYWIPTASVIMVYKIVNIYLSIERHHEKHKIPPPRPFMHHSSSILPQIHRSNAITRPSHQWRHFLATNNE